MSAPTIEHLAATDVDVSVDIGSKPGSLVLLLLSAVAGVAVQGNRNQLRDLVDDIVSALDDPALRGRMTPAAAATMGPVPAINQDAEPIAGAR